MLDDPPLLDRLTWREGIQPQTLISLDRGLLARTVGTLCLVGALIGLAILISGDEGRDSDKAVRIGVLFGSVGLAVVSFVGYARLPLWFFHLLMALGTLMITAAVAEAPEGAMAVYGTFYIWIFFLVFFFFPLRAAYAHGLFAALAWTTVLIVRDAPYTFSFLIAGVGVLATTGGIMGLMRRRVERVAAELATEANTDVLTALANRRGFDQRFERELARATRNRRPLSLVICDLDRFKTVNDELGHVEGDAALRRAAAAITAAIRSIDVVSRVGGEEFAALLPEADGDRAFVVAERLRVAIRETFADHPVKLTASCGVATLDHEETTEGGQLFRAADAALYVAKRSGRNRSVAADHPDGFRPASSTK